MTFETQLYFLGFFIGKTSTFLVKMVLWSLCVFCVFVFFIKLQTWGLQFIKKETLAQVFSCEFCKISKKTFLP